MKKLISIALALALTSCSTVSIEDLAARCDTYGFERGTQAHAACIQQEVRAIEVRQAQSAQRMQNFGRALQGLDASTNASTSTSGSGGMTCFKKSEAVSGFNKICYYNCLGSVRAVNIPNTSLCQLSIRQ